MRLWKISRLHLSKGAILVMCVCPLALEKLGSFVPGGVVPFFICLLQQKKTSIANVWSHKVGLASLLLLRGKCPRQLVPLENANVPSPNHSITSSFSSSTPSETSRTLSKKRKGQRNALKAVRGVYSQERQDMDLSYVLQHGRLYPCLLYTSPSPRDLSTSRMPSSA